MPASIQQRILLLVCLIGALWPVQSAAQSGVAYLALTHLEARAKTVGQVEVVARLSVLDEQGHPVTGLVANDFTLSENNQTIDRAALTVMPATNPVTVTLLLDTSDQMARPGPNGVRAIDSAKDAAIAFAERLGPDDRLAVYEFTQQPERHQDFTFDHNLAIDRGIMPLDARPELPACFYDALLTTLERLAANPAGPNFVVAVTGNPLPGPECGNTTVDDLLDITTPAGNSIPVYTIAFGPDVDTDPLLRLGRRTGGYTWLAPDSAALPDFATQLSAQLSRQYQLSYVTQAAPGLTRVSIMENNSQQTSHRQVVIPPPIQPTATPPPQYTIGLSVQQQTPEMLAVQLAVPPEVTLTRADLYLDNELLQTRTEAPFDTFDLEISTLESGQHLLRAEVVDIHQVTAVAEVELTLTLPPTPTPAPTPPAPPPPEPEQSGVSFVTPALAIILVGGGVLLLLIFLGLMGWFLLFRPKKGDKITPAPASAPPPRPTGPATLLDVEAPPPSAVPTGPATLLDVEAPPTVVSSTAGSASAKPGQARLVVMAYHQLTPQPVYNLSSQPPTHIGRNTAKQAVNQIPVQDKEVSRSHARIICQQGQYWLEDLNSTTGTFVDGIKIQPEQPYLLQNGSEITVGLRVKFIFEIGPAPPTGDETLIDFGTDEIQAKYKGQDPHRTLYD